MPNTTIRLISDRCRECGRMFDLLDPQDAAEYSAGHDCEPMTSFEQEAMRWVAVCQDDWYDLFPSEYFPDEPGYGTCALCENYGLVTHINSKSISAAKRQKETQ